MITIPFDSVSGTSLLFNDYCHNRAEANKYFIGHFTDPAAYEAQLQFLSQRTYHRSELADILLRQNREFQSSNAALAGAELIRESNTYCVVTGQQVGLFTGPLYTIYKALTAIKLSEWLADRFPSHNFVPVFWLETEDHDLEEANEAGFINRENDYTTVRNGEIDPEIKNHYPVGNLPLDATIEETIQQIRDLLQVSDFSEAMLTNLVKQYSQNETYGSAFPKFFNSLFPESKIVFVDPSDKSLKQLLAPVIKREIDTHPTTSEIVISISADLEEHYHAQVKPRALNLFFMHNEKRYAVEPAENDYFLRGSRRRLSQDEITQYAEESPELFSPNVLLRPIFQDNLFPTISYVAGPAEVAYFAQLGPVYDHFQTPMPIIFPRASISILEKKTMAVLEKYNLPFASIFLGEEELLREVLVHSAGEDSTIHEYKDLKDRLDETFAMLKEFAVTFDANLSGPAQTTIDNMSRSLNTFEEKMFQMKKQQDEVAKRQISKLLTHLLPEGKPQERMVNILTYLNKYGPAVLDEIERTCQPFPAEHRFLIL